ncbi:uncharacterized protein [Fopius arisanus]|uniref:Uncharacterized protein n=1 Tax=Fopius arisanus TaxID=64838 RepID=A0A9R1T6P5_9HYME|nr:PREDICTED: uncharacterized protein LOC105266928 [Fopius arisanus]
MEPPDNLQELQTRLAAEESCLKKSLDQIEEQINVLQIEQLHLIALLKNSSKDSAKGEKSKTEEPETKVEELDLSVPFHMEVFVEEEEDEDDEDM